MRRGKAILFILTIVSILPCTASVAFDNNTNIMHWQNTCVVNCKIFAASDGYAYAEASVMGHATVNKISADVYVYRQVGSSWLYVGEEHKTVNSCTLTIRYRFTPIHSFYYSVDFT